MEHTRTIKTPVGPMIAACGLEGLAALEFAGPRAAKAIRAVSPEPDEHGILDETERQLAAYFAGDLTTFDLPLELFGSSFEVRVWQALREIPFGETTSYGELAESLGSPGASRAVGVANGKNRLAIVVPCHRVIGADGSLTGYGGGLDRKRTLLEHEGALAPDRGLFADGR
ncbi:MAG: methylated-DNA--[protein]-cysteine S-methyltransferase [Planctomycetota bacterium]